MTIDFPDNPTGGDVFQSGGKSWRYDAAKGWELQSVSVSEFSTELAKKQNKTILSETQPSSAEDGDEWVDTSASGGLKKFTRYSGAWVELGPSGGGVVGQGSGSGGHLIEVKKVTQRQFASVPVTLGNTEEWRTVFILTANNVKTGEIFSINYENQVTTELNYNVDLTNLIEIRKWVGTNPESGTVHSGGTEPLMDGSTISDWHSPITGHNISQGAVHHQDTQRSWLFVADKGYPVLYICGRARARSSGAGAGAALNIDEGQGALWYQRFSPLSGV